MELKEIDTENKEITFAVECSKGTYIRSLIRDMGENFGTGAAMSKLLRDEVNGIKAENGFRISDLQQMKADGTLSNAVLQMDELLKDFPAVNINESGIKYLSNGNRLKAKNFTVRAEAGKADSDFETLNGSDFFRVYDEEGLKALYAYDSSSNDYKVYKML